MRVMLRRLQFVKQSKRWHGQGIASLPFQAIPPLEIATGRRPPDLFDVETCSPEQLSVDPSSEDRTTLGTSEDCSESSSRSQTSH